MVVATFSCSRSLSGGSYSYRHGVFTKTHRAATIRARECFYRNRRGTLRSQKRLPPIRFAKQCQRASYGSVLQGVLDALTYLFCQRRASQHGGKARERASNAQKRSEEAIRGRGRAPGRAPNAQKRSEEATRARAGVMERAPNAQKRSEEATRARGNGPETSKQICQR